MRSPQNLPDPTDIAKPRIGITIGDVAGIGPEIVLRSLKSDDALSKATPFLIGDLSYIRELSATMGLGHGFYDAELTSEQYDGSIAVFDRGKLGEKPVLGTESADTGRAAGECIEAAVDLWKTKRIDAIATAPISKHSLALGGFKYPGHTEFLAKLTGTEEFAMSFFGGDLRVVLISTHLSLRDAIEKVTTESLTGLIRFSAAQFEDLLGRKVRIAVAGINPHASEGGMFGSEEAEIMIPAIGSCKEKGIDVSGPYAADTIFLRAYKGEFDAVIACYHDQATIAVKSLAFGSAVNVTLGLPLIRTSVDHGTAFDIAGKFIADESSMLAAIKLAAELVNIRKRRN